jgi:hypothetical protein
MFSVHTYDMRLSPSIADIEAHILDEKVMCHDLCLLEWNATDKSISELDQFMRAVHNRVANNGIFGCLFSSPKKSILYMNVKVR